jgi:hypothetical protein
VGQNVNNDAAGNVVRSAVGATGGEGERHFVSFVCAYGVSLYAAGGFVNCSPVTGW